MCVTAEGELFVVEGYEMKQYIENAFNTSGGVSGSGDASNPGGAGAEEEIVNVTSVKEFSKGFFVASDSGHMAVWIRSEENNSTSGK